MKEMRGSSESHTVAFTAGKVVMIDELDESIWLQSDVSSWRRVGEDLACCYGNLIDAARSRRKSTLCAELVTWKQECHVANQIAPGSELATTFIQEML